MEQQANTELLPAIVLIDDEAFGNLINMPALYAQGLASLHNAKAAVDPLIKTIEAHDMTKVDALVMEALIQPIRDIRPLLVDTKKCMNEDRAPHTRKMDAMKSLFTGLENDIDALHAKAAAKENAWELEKLSRQKIATKLAADKIQKETEAIQIRANVTNIINKKFADALIVEITGMTTAYYSKTADTLADYGEALVGWTPEMDADTYGLITTNILLSGTLHPMPEKMAIYEDVKNSLLPGLQSEWIEKVSAERDRLYVLIPSRVTELATITAEASNESAAKAVEAVAATITAEASNKEEAVALQADTEQLDSSFTHSAAAMPSVGLSKGSKVRQKYIPESHKSFTAIIQSWVKNDMGKLTIEELTKKLSFMITAANEQLNKGVKLEAEGLSVVDDISTRVKRTA